MKVKIELNENDLKELIKKHIEDCMNETIDIKNIEIQVKSKQNYKSEWENANFRAEYSK